MSNVLRLSARAPLLSLGLALSSSATIAAASPSVSHARARLPRMAAKHARCDGHRGGGNRMTAGAPAPSTQPTVQAPMPKSTTAINSFIANPARLTKGQTGRLEWAVSNVDTVSLVPSIQSFGTNSATIAPTVTTTYALNVAGPGGAALQFLTVEVYDGTPPPAKVIAPVVAPPPSVAPAPTTSAAVSGDDLHPAGYTLVFNDEFAGTALDRGLWCTRYAYGGGPVLQIDDPDCTGPDGHSGTLDFLNAEQQRYVDTNTRGETMHVLSGGVLQLRATKTGTDSYAAYESAMIRSKYSFKPDASASYYIATRVRLPNVKGTWPAVWLASGFGTNGDLVWPPEIDIVEAPLNGLDMTINTIRMGSQVHAAQTGSGSEEWTFLHPVFKKNSDNYTPSRPLHGVWLVIGAEWTANAICYFADGVKTMCENYRWVDDQAAPANAAELLLNLAIGGDWAGAGGIEDALFPTEFDVDYVRVYRK